MSTSRKDSIRNWIETKFDKLHRLTDKLPLGILDGILHGTSRGLHNFLMDVHPTQDNTVVNTDVYEFFYMIKSFDDWKNKYPVRFAEFQRQCFSKNSLQNLLDSLEQGITISCQGYKPITFVINNETRIQWEKCFLKHKNYPIQDKIKETDRQILTDLELISNKLQLLQFNQNEVLQKEISSFTSEFQIEINGIKSQLESLTRDMTKVVTNTDLTLKNTNSIESKVDQLAIQQEQIKILLNQVVGQN